MQNIIEINSVSIVGAGNVGWHMAKALKSSGIEIINVISPTLEKAVEVADQAGAKAVTDISEIVRLPDLFLLCVSDDAIGSLAAKYHEKGVFVAHTSGSTDMNVFGPGDTPVGVFYPLQTFTRKNPMDYRTITFFIEGSSFELEKSLSVLAEKISGNWEVADSQKRKLIHIAAVFSCNFTNHMWAISEFILKELNLDFTILTPLIEETVGKLKKMNPQDAQTGPAKRMDLKTIQGHIEALGNKEGEKEIYKQISQNIINYTKSVNE